MTEKDLNLEELEEIEDLEVNIIEQERPSEIIEAQVAVAKPLDIELDFSKLNQPGTLVGDVGMTLSRFKVDKARFTVSSKAMVSILTDRVIAVKTHYNEVLGSYLCFEGECCETDGLPRVKYIFPIVMYDTNKKGIPVSRDISNKALVVGQRTYEDIVTLSELSENGIAGLDLLVTCKDEQYQTISLVAAGEARYKKEPSMIKQVQEFWKNNMDHITQSTARFVSKAKFNEAMGQDVGTAAADIEMDDIFS